MDAKGQMMTDVSGESYLRLIALAPQLAELVADMAEALDAILHELGIPDENYPAPVANAVDHLAERPGAGETPFRKPKMEQLR